MKITSYKLVDGLPLINQYLASGYTVFGNPLIEANGRIMQVMILEEPEITLQAKTVVDIKEIKGSKKI